MRQAKEHPRERRPPQWSGAPGARPRNRRRTPTAREAAARRVPVRARALLNKNSIAWVMRDVEEVRR